MSFQLKLERRHRLSTPSSKQLNSLWLHMLQGLPCTSAANAKHSGEAFPHPLVLFPAGTSFPNVDGTASHCR